jgi:hypothetical protein
MLQTCGMKPLTNALALRFVKSCILKEHWISVKPMDLIRHSSELWWYIIHAATVANFLICYLLGLRPMFIDRVWWLTALCWA